MNSLVIGNTSQLAKYFPDDYEKISSRNIDIHNLVDRRFDRIFLTFAEQRTYKKDAPFAKINIRLTTDIFTLLRHQANKIIVYGTCELWNNCEGPIDINTPFNFNSTPYIESKKNMCWEIQNQREISRISAPKLKNVIIIHPFNFNSVYRKGDFLFAKIFESLTKEAHITIGNTHFYRDLTHPEHIVNRSILAEKDEIVGSGRLVFVNDFIRDLYDGMGLNYEELVTEDFDSSLKNRRRIFYNSKKDYSYKKLLDKTLNELRRIKNTIS